jgi:hypothetical protein
MSPVASPDAALDVAAIVGGLGHLPENARFEGDLVGVLWAAVTGETQRRMSAPSQKQVQRLIETHRGSRWDPPETLFTTRIPFYGGDLLALTGGYLELDKALERMIASLFLGREKPPAALVREAFSLVGAALRLGDFAARAAGLRRAMPCAEAGDIVVPQTGELRQLLGSVSFTTSQLDEITRGGASALRPLVAEVTSLMRPEHGVGELGVTPILRHGDRYVLAAPGCLLLGVRHQLVLIAQAHGWGDQLASRMLDHAELTTEAALDRMEWERVDVRP